VFHPVAFEASAESTLFAAMYKLPKYKVLTVNLHVRVEIYKG